MDHVGSMAFPFHAEGGSGRTRFSSSCVHPCVALSVSPMSDDSWAMSPEARGKNAAVLPASARGAVLADAEIWKGPRWRLSRVRN